MARRRTLRWTAVAAAALGGLLAAGCGPVPATPNTDYQLQEGTTRSCSATPGPLLNFMSPPGGGFSSLNPVIESVDGVSEYVYRFTPGVGFKIAPTTGEAGNTTYSIVVLFRLSDLGVFRRLVDFKHGTSDTGLYLSAGRLRLYPYTSTGSKQLAADEWAQAVLTRTAAGTVTGYVDGVEQWQFADTAGVGIIDSSNELRFFQDNQSGGTTTEHAAGALARIRLFDRALTATEVGSLGQTPATPCAT